MPKIFLCDFFLLISNPSSEMALVNLLGRCLIKKLIFFFAFNETLFFIYKEKGNFRAGWRALFSVAGHRNVGLKINFQNTKQLHLLLINYLRAERVMWWILNIEIVRLLARLSIEVWIFFWNESLYKRALFSICQTLLFMKSFVCFYHVESHSLYSS